MGMPTAAKLFSAIIFAGVAWLAAHVYTQGMPEGRSSGLLREISAMIGVICGWSIMGGFASRRTGRIEAMGTGIRTSFTIAVAVTIVFATTEMLTRSMKGRYKDPMEAVMSLFSLILEFGQSLLTPNILAVLLLGGLLGGAVGHWAGRTWR